MNARPSIEASAVLRPNGRWSVLIGPESVFRRLVRRPSENQALEKRMGMLASCTAAIVSVAFEEAGIQNHEIRVRVESLPGPRLIINIAVECEADTRTAQSVCDLKVRSNPVLATLTHDCADVEFRVQTHSSIPLRIS